MSRAAEKVRIKEHWLYFTDDRYSRKSRLAFKEITGQNMEKDGLGQGCRQEQCYNYRQVSSSGMSRKQNIGTKVEIE